MNFFGGSVVEQIKGFSLPKVCMGKECYVSFAAFDPNSGRMKRKKIMLDRMKTKAEKRKYGERIVRELTMKLLEGWNPWMEQAHPLGYTELEDVCDRYRDYAMKQLEHGDMREQTVASYLSSLNILRQWAKREGVKYVFNLDRRRVAAFLDYVYIERNNKLQTRNNYLAWLKVFCQWMLQRGFLDNDPTQGMKQVMRRGTKDRDVIPDDVLKRIREYLEGKNRHFLLACYLMHYCFLRPHEMSLLKIGDFSLKKQTIFVRGDVSKNHKDATITLPSAVAQLMVKLDVFSHPSGDYLFSTKDFRPGRERHSEKTFRDFWIRYVRKDLGLSPRYKFYSLKDSGITGMLRAKKDVLSVRDQARHSSIAITDIYTPRDIQEANELLKDYVGAF